MRIEECNYSPQRHRVHRDVIFFDLQRPARQCLVYFHLFICHTVIVFIPLGGTSVWLWQAGLPANENHQSSLRLKEILVLILRVILFVHRRPRLPKPDPCYS
jgi:hypothetical protein